MAHVPQNPDDAIPILDLRGLKCPLPVLRTRKALRGLAPGTRLLVLCTDPLAAIDIPHCLRESGDALMAQSMANGVSRFVVRKGDVPDENTRMPS